ncbi:PilN domain-containing protein [Caldicellulosiruptoraceae bacterium PP1]
MANKLKDINLYEAYILSSKPQSKGTRVFVLLFILEILILVFIFSTNVTKYNMIINDNKRLNNEINVKQQQLAQVEIFTKKKNLLNQKQTILDYIIIQHQRYLKTLDILENIAPSKIVYNNVNLELNKVTCNISGDSYETVTQFVYNMQNSGYFSNISFNTINSSNSIYTSIISADIVGK